MLRPLSIGILASLFLSGCLTQTPYVRVDQSANLADQSLWHSLRGVQSATLTYEGTAASRRKYGNQFDPNSELRSGNLRLDRNYTRAIPEAPLVLVADRFSINAQPIEPTALGIYGWFANKTVNDALLREERQCVQFTPIDRPSTNTLLLETPDGLRKVAVKVRPGVGTASISGNLIPTASIEWTETGTDRAGQKISVNKVIYVSNQIPGRVSSASCFSYANGILIESQELTLREINKRFQSAPGRSDSRTN